MSNPTPYDPEYSFTGWQAVNPTRPLPAPELDNELANIATAIDSDRAAIMDVRRADGVLQNSVVTPDSLNASSLALIGGAGVPRGAWAAVTAYAVKDLVTFSGTTYIAVLAHTSTSVFANDLAAGDWLAFAVSGDVTGVPYFEFFDGSGVSQTLTLADNFGTDSLAVEVYIKEDGAGFERMDPSTYTLNGVSLTGTFPAGTRTVLVFSPSTTLTAVLNAANVAAAAAAASAVTATTQAGTATTQAGIATAQAVIATAQAVISTTQAGNSATSAALSATYAGSVKATPADTTPGPLSTKSPVGASLVATVTNPAANEVRTLTRAALTGDITAAADSNATTLATVNSNVGSFTHSSITVNAKGLVTAAASGAAAALSASYVSPDQTITLAGALTLAHSLGAAPKLIQVWLKNTTAEAGYSIGDLTPIDGNHENDGTNIRGVSMVADATNLNVRYGSTNLVIANKGTGATFTLTPANWKMIFKAWA